MHFFVFDCQREIFCISTLLCIFKYKGHLLLRPVTQVLLSLLSSLLLIKAIAGSVVSEFTYRDSSIAVRNKESINIVLFPRQNGEHLQVFLEAVLSDPCILEELVQCNDG